MSTPYGVPSSEGTFPSFVLIPVLLPAPCLVLSSVPAGVETRPRFRPLWRGMEAAHFGGGRVLCSLTANPGLYLGGWRDGSTAVMTLRPRFRPAFWASGKEGSR